MNKKALRINLEGKRYGTFAEIGAVRKWPAAFSRWAGATGTIAKTMSAYEIAV